MDKLQKITVDCSTGEQIIEDLTEEEIADLQKLHAEIEAEQLAEKAKLEAKAEAKASAIAKLAALGLTEEEAAAIAGA